MSESGYPPYDPQASTPPPIPPEYAAARASASSPASQSLAATLPQPPVIQVVNQRSGFGRIVGGWITALTLLGAVFAIGIGAGLVIFIALGLWVGGSAMDAWVPHYTYRDGGGRTIAIIPVEGVIDGGKAQFVRACVDDVLGNASIRAVVLRVDSPGGGVTASDQIWYEVGRLKNAGRTVVASYGGVATSGGYYVSCGSDFIMAEETTITGSIGVIAQILTMEGLMDKVGIEPVTLVASGSPQKATANDIFRTWNDEDRAEVMQMLDHAYNIFAQRVGAGRAQAITAPATVNKLADGSIYTAADGLKHGLIDGIGYLDDAIAKAETLARLPTGKPTVRRYFQQRGFFSGLPGINSTASDSRDPFNAERIRSLVNDLGSVRLMYLMH